MNLLVIPYSTLFIFLVSSLMSLLSALLSRRVIDVAALRALSEKRKELMRLMKEAKSQKSEKARQKALAKLKRKQLALQRIQMAIMAQQMKVWLILLVFFWLIFMFLNNMYRGVIVAHSPIPIPFFGYELNFLGWYIVCSFWTGTLIMRLAGIYME